MIKFKSIFEYIIIVLLIAGSLTIIKATDIYAYEDDDPYTINVVRPCLNQK